MVDKSILKEQVAYYRARAAEYDEWHSRQGTIRPGATSTNSSGMQNWILCDRHLSGSSRSASVLSLLAARDCGRHVWYRVTDDLTAIDASPETIEINRTKIGNAPVQYVVVDLFEWWPTETYDFVFFGFWLSHVPAQQFNRLWEMVRAALKPGGRAFFVDGLGDSRVNRTGSRCNRRFWRNGTEAERWPDI